ncbi:MAG: hypothetical protein ACI80M_001596 [Gammaproteobacteria bacterium]
MRLSAKHCSFLTGGEQQRAPTTRPRIAATGAIRVYLNLTHSNTLI